MNKLVSFHLNKLLKDSGFDYHQLYQDLSEEYDYLVEGQYHRRHNSDFSEDQFPNDNWLPVPYIHQIVDWLYKTHNTWIAVENLMDNKFYFSIRDTKTSDYASRKGCNEDGYESDDQAYEAAIKYYLINN